MQNSRTQDKRVEKANTSPQVETAAKTIKIGHTAFAITTTETKTIS